MPLLTANGMIPDMAWAHFESSGQDGKAKRLDSVIRVKGVRSAIPLSSPFLRLPASRDLGHAHQSLSACRPLAFVSAQRERRGNQKGFNFHQLGAFFSKGDDQGSAIREIHLIARCCMAQDDRSRHNWNGPVANDATHPMAEGKEVELCLWPFCLLFARSGQ